MVERTSLFACVLLLGPAAPAAEIDLWQQCGSPESRVVQCLTVTPRGDLLAGTLSGGLFRSNDRAGTWTRLEAGFPNDNVLAMAVCPDGAILAATFGGGVYRSVDGGGAWEPMNEGLGDFEVIALASAGTRGVYAVTARKGIYRCDGSGGGWDYIALNGVLLNALTVTSGGTLVAGTSGEGIMVSFDSGRNWLKANGALRGRDVWAVGVDDAGRIYAATNGGGVLRSVDDGRTWRQVNTGLTAPYVGSLFVIGHEVYAGTAEGVFRSDDGGGTWVPVNGGSSARAIKCLVGGAGETIFVSTPLGGIFRRALVEFSLR